MGVRTFRHEVLCYEGLTGYLADVVPVVDEGVASGAAVMVAGPRRRLDELADALGPRARSVDLVEIETPGRNPGRLIDAWQELLARELTSGRPVLGVSEVLSADRVADEVDECVTHEHLVNAAFEGRTRFRMVCPLDVTAIGSAVVDEMLAAHPVVGGRDRVDRRATFHAPSAAELLGRPLSSTPDDAVRIVVEPGSLPALRRSVRAAAEAAGLAPAERVDDMVLAASEIGANSVLHGGGSGRLAIWSDASALWCEVSDAGHIDDPLIGRRRARLDDQGGRGIWIAHQVCDLVQVRTGTAGTTVRLRMVLAPGR